MTTIVPVALSPVASWSNRLALLCIAFGSVVIIAELLRLVKRAERAAARAEAAARQSNPEFVVIGRDSDDTIMRMAARWGAEVLDAIANGSSGVEAVRRAAPRVGGLQRVPEDGHWDAGSEVSTDDLHAAPRSDQNDWIARASQSVTPVPDVGRGLHELSGKAAWQPAADTTMINGGTFISGVHSTHSAMVHRPVATAVRPSRSPTHD